MMRDRRCGERHEGSGSDFYLFAVNFSNAATRNNIKPLFFGLMGVVSKGFLAGWYARDAHAVPLQANGATELHADQARFWFHGCVRTAARVA